jgi:nicotinamidase-related amidase
MKTSKALLVIDMQKGCFTPDPVIYDAEGVINRINSLSNKFRENNQAVIFIQHDSSRWNRFVPDTTEWELLSELDVKTDDYFIGKSANNAFYKSDLLRTLKERSISEVMIVGFATDYCVEATVQGALNQDLNVTVVKNCHTTGDKEHISAEKVIEHFNWQWQNMLPTEGHIKVISFEEVASQFFKFTT